MIVSHLAIPRGSHNSLQGALSLSSAMFSDDVGGFADDDDYVGDDDVTRESTLSTFLATCKASPWDTGAWVSAALASIFLFTSSGVWWLMTTTVDGIVTVTLNIGAFQQCYSVTGLPQLSQSTCSSGPPQNDPLYTWILACAVVNIVAGILSTALVLLILIRQFLPFSRAAEVATRERLLVLSGALVCASVAVAYAASVKGAVLMQYYSDALPSDSTTITFHLPGLIVSIFASFFSILSFASLWRVRGSEADYAATGAYYTSVNDAEAPPPPKRSKARPAPRRAAPQPPPRVPIQREANVYRAHAVPSAAPATPRFMSVAPIQQPGAPPPQGITSPAKKGAFTRRLKSVVAATAGDVASEQDMLYLVSRVLSAIDNIAPEVSDEELLAHTLDFMREVFDERGVKTATAVAWLNAARMKIEGGGAR